MRTATKLRKNNRAKLLFNASLLSSAIAERGANTTPTFTHTTASSVYDFESLDKTVKSGEAMFTGERRVENGLTYSEDFTQLNGGITSGTPTVTANSIVFTSANDYRYKKATSSLTAIAGKKFVGQVKLSSPDGKTKIGLSITTLHESGDASIALTTTPTIYSISYTTPVTRNDPIQFGLDNRTIVGGDGTVTGTVVATDWQLEEVTGQTNQNPSEYISTNVLSGTYHGVSVDGVKYFTYQNGNTVSSNVITEAKGSDISESILKGYFAHKSTTNLCLYSQDLTNWTNIGSPTITSVSQNNGYETLDTIDDQSTIEVSGKQISITFTGDGSKSIQFVIKKGTATASHVRLYDTVGAVRMGCDITWSGTVPTISMTTGTEEKAKLALVDGCYRIFTLATGVVAANTNQLEIYPATDNAFGILSTGTLLIGCVQSQDSNISGPYLKTTTATVNSLAPSLSYSTTGNIKATKGTLAIVFENSTSSVYTGYLYSSYTDANNYTSLFFDGTNLVFRKRIAGTNYDASIAFAYAAYTRYKIACSWGPAGTSIYLQNVKGTGNVNSEAPVFSSTFKLCNDGNSGNYVSGYIRDCKIYNKQLNDSKALALTA